MKNKIRNELAVCGFATVKKLKKTILKKYQDYILQLKSLLFSVDYVKSLQRTREFTIKLKLKT